MFWYRSCYKSCSKIIHRFLLFRWQRLKQSLRASILALNPPCNGSGPPSQIICWKGRQRMWLISYGRLSLSIEYLCYVLFTSDRVQVYLDSSFVRTRRARAYEEELWLGISCLRGCSLIYSRKMTSDSTRLTMHYRKDGYSLWAAFRAWTFLFYARNFKPGNHEVLLSRSSTYWDLHTSTLLTLTSVAY